MSDVSAQSATANIPQSHSLASYTTLRLGGPAQRVISAVNQDEIIRFVREAEERREPLLLLAGGSNVVIGDDGFAGSVLLIRSRGTEQLPADPAEPDQVTVRVQAGEPWDEFVAGTVAAGLSGLECLSGIPGSAGATPIQNVGAYGQEVAETVAAVEAYDRSTGAVTRMTAGECDFAYRSSVFRHSDRYVVLSVDFRLTRSPLSAPVRYAELARKLGVEVGDRVPLAQARDAVRALRAGKGMVLDPDDPDTRSAGSFFTNPVLDAAGWVRLRERAGEAGEPPHWPLPDGRVKVSAAWLIDKSGFGKGYRSGGAAISGKHTLALTNRDAHSTAELIALAREIRDGVRERFGVTLHPEPILINCVI
ncbi:UDP-N-acetylmuramate dehydrogenase [Melissospora conviva]|uniref:UDP-N-acetylmuramate dehydrogenase n=1 Tax=Melissospora conviva TaxID=3388432 RepID=UPI003C13257B